MMRTVGWFARRLGLGQGRRGAAETIFDLQPQSEPQPGFCFFAKARRVSHVAARATRASAASV